MSSRVCILPFLVGFSFLVIGCGKAPPQDEFLTADKTPPTVTESATKAYPGLVVEQIWKYEENGETRYEIRGKTPDHQVREVTVSEAGQVLWPVQSK